MGVWIVLLVAGGVLNLRAGWAGGRDPHRGPVTLLTTAVVLASLFTRGDVGFIAWLGVAVLALAPGLAVRRARR